MVLLTHFFYLHIVGVGHFHTIARTLSHSQAHTHIHSVGLPWWRDRPLAKACTYTTHNNHKREISMSPVVSNLSSQQVSGRSPAPYAVRRWNRIGRILPAANGTFPHMKYVIENTYNFSERKTTHHTMANILFHSISNIQLGIKLNFQQLNIWMEFQWTPLSF